MRDIAGLDKEELQNELLMESIRSKRAYTLYLAAREQREIARTLSIEQDRITAGEAVYGFMESLTIRRKPITFGIKQDPSVAAKLAKEWLITNGLVVPV